MSIFTPRLSAFIQANEKLKRNNNFFDFRKAKDIISVMEASRHSNNDKLTYEKSPHQIPVFRSEESQVFLFQLIKFKEVFERLVVQVRTVTE